MCMSVCGVRMCLQCYIPFFVHALRRKKDVEYSIMFSFFFSLETKSFTDPGAGCQSVRLSDPPLFTLSSVGVTGTLPHQDFYVDAGSLSSHLQSKHSYYRFFGF